LGGWLGQAHSQGVGNMLAYKCIQETNGIVQNIQKIHKEILENRYLNEDMSLGSFEDKFGQSFPLLLVSFYKNQQVKACWKC
jgi:hypothetical protein